jgi:hypothetical protein
VRDEDGGDAASDDDGEADHRGVRVAEPGQQYLAGLVTEPDAGVEREQEEHHRRAVGQGQVPAAAEAAEQSAGASLRGQVSDHAGLNGYRGRDDGDDQGEDGPPRPGPRLDLGDVLAGRVELTSLLQIHVPTLPRQAQTGPGDS